MRGIISNLRSFVNYVSWADLVDYLLHIIAVEFLFSVTECKIN